ALCCAPPVLHGMGARFQAINRNKLSVTLELKSPDDRAKLKRLVAEADVFVHNMRPGVAESLGLSGPEALTLNPRLIYCAIGAYGSKGPWRRWSAYSGLPQALSTQMFGNGEPDGQPLLVADAIVDKGAGMWAAIAILAALHDRARTGKGSIVETSLLEAALFWRDGVFARMSAVGARHVVRATDPRKSCLTVYSRRRTGRSCLASPAMACSRHS